MAWSWPGISEGHRAVGQTETQKEVPGRTVKSRLPEQGQDWGENTGPGEKEALGCALFPGDADTAGPGGHTKRPGCEGESPLPSVTVKTWVQQALARPLKSCGRR